MSYFNEDDYKDLKQEPIKNTNVTILELFDCLYNKYSKKTEELQIKVLADLEEDLNISKPSNRPSKIKQEKLKLFLYNTEQAIPNGIYVKKCIRVIKQFSYINKDVLKLRAQTLNKCTIALF